jgi:DNA-binding transcriptional ArsR family regulator
MVDRDYILAPKVMPFDFALEPAVNQMESLELLSQTHELSGLGDWIIKTAAAMPADLMEHHMLVSRGFSWLIHYSHPVRPQQTGIPDYLDDLAAQNPIKLRDTLLHIWLTEAMLYVEPRPTSLPTAAQILADRELFAQGVALIDECVLPFTDQLYALINEPEQMQRTIIEHLRLMWDEYLCDEWARVLPMLQESIAAHQRVVYPEMTPYEAIRAITGRDMSGRLDTKLNRSERLRFVPSAHVGPYIAKSLRGSTMIVMFGARLPRGSSVTSPDLNRAELLTRMNALADDTRLRILELLTREPELCAQDIIERLGDLSQSSVSRHLSQLTATGYITERRREQAKCYSLNTDRVFDTIRALTNFLSRQY